MQHSYSEKGWIHMFKIQNNWSKIKPLIEPYSYNILYAAKYKNLEDLSDFIKKNTIDM